MGADFFTREVRAVFFEGGAAFTMSLISPKSNEEYMIPR